MSEITLNFTELRDNNKTIQKTIHINPDGTTTKTPGAQITSGTAKTVCLSPPEFISYLTDISTKPDTCIVTGVWLDGHTTYTEYDITVQGQENPSAGLVSRTKDFFKYLNSDSISFMVFDIDGEYTENQVHEFISRLETTLSDAILNSSKLMRFEKPSTSAGVKVNGKVCGTGLHIYVPVRNMTADLLSDIFKWSWLNGWKSHMISNAGTILSRSIIDAAVGDPNRIVFESNALVTGSVELAELVDRNCSYFPGGAIDCELARGILFDNISSYGKEWSQYKAAIEKTPEVAAEISRLKAAHKAKLLAKAALQGVVLNASDVSVVSKNVDMLFEKHIIPSSEELLKSDGSTVPVLDILLDRDFYAGQTKFQDFISPEHGTNKAMILVNGIDDSVRLKSFAHGGVYYYLKFTFQHLMEWISSANDDDILTRFSSFASQSILSPVELDMALTEAKKKNKAFTMKALRDEFKIKSNSVLKKEVLDSIEDSSADFSTIDPKSTHAEIASDILGAMGHCRFFGGKLYVADKSIWKDMRVESLYERISNRYKYCDLCKNGSHYSQITKVALQKDRLYCEEWPTPAGIPCASQFLQVGDKIQGEMSGVSVKGVQWVDYNLELGCRFKLKVNPDWNCPTPYWNKVLNNVVNAQCFKQAFGLTLAGYLTPHLQKALVLYGEGGTGKGTVNSVFMAMLPRGRVTNLSFHQMSDQKSVIALSESVINFMTETKKSGRPYDLEGFKKATGGDNIQAWILYKGSINFRPTTSQVLNFNDWPRLTSAGSDIKRRLGHFIVEFQRNQEADVVDLVDKIIEYELPGVLAWAIDGIISFFRDGIDDGYSLKLFDRWVGSFDPVTAFLEECVEQVPRMQGRISRSAIWKMYCAWCGDAGFDPGNKSELNTELEKRLGAAEWSHGEFWFVGAIATSVGRDLAKGAGVGALDRVGRKRAPRGNTARMG